MQPIKNATNILSNKQPDTVEVSGCTYAVKTGFREWINFFITHENNEISSEKKILLSLKMYTQGIPKDILAAYAALQRFAACNGMPRNTGKNSGDSNTPVFSYLYDSMYIYSDFLRYYSIDLQTAEMHWYTFTALFDGLPQESETKQRIAYRSIKAYEIKDNSRREQILQIQASIRIPHENISVGEIGSKLW